MAQTTIIIDHGAETKADIDGIFQPPGLLAKDVAARMSRFFHEVAVGARRADWNVHVAESSSPATYASGQLTITLAGAQVGNALSIAGRDMFSVASDPDTDEWVNETDDDTTAENVKVAINNTCGNFVTATRVDNVVTITSKYLGGIGNYIAYRETAPNIVPSPTWRLAGATGDAVAPTSYSRK